MDYELKKIRHVALDMDGTIYLGNTLFPYTLDFLHQLDELGITYSFLTNNPSRSIADYLLKLHKMGIEATREEIYNTTVATIDYLHAHFPEVRRLFLLGTPSMISQFEEAGFISVPDSPTDRPDAVVVAFDMTLTYARLCRACWWVSQGLPYLATNPDRVCPTNEKTILVDCGSICRCIEHATGRCPDITLGKPDPNMLVGIRQQRNLQPEEIAMVGDRIYTDIEMARRAGALGVLVLSGETTMQIVNEAPNKPDLILPSVKELGELLARSRK
ncbi:MAG: HAD-IIA family hydrolase [Bacteroidaceae bacterium]|nr:HAD-IIA family hydrolase [Bacteroidaceae bacterium]